MEGPEFQICKTCRKPVDIYCEYDDQGNETLRVLVHMNLLGQTPEHEIVPIPREPGIEVNDFCDFCGAPQPAWVFPATDFDDTDASPTIISQGAWMGCSDCRPLVQALDWDGVVDRFIEKRFGKLTKAQRAELLRRFTPLWERFTAARAGPPVPR